MIVVDVNVIAYLLIQGAESASAQRVREKDDVWLVQSLWRYEFTNVMSLYVRHREMPEPTGAEILTQAVQLFEPAEHPVDARKAFELALHLGVSAYDAHYLALAEQLETWCVTEDRRLRAAAPDRACFMHELLN